jgi:hypothetical protein
MDLSDNRKIRVSRFFEGVSTFLTPFEKTPELTDYVLFPHKKITSSTIRNSGELIVI